MYEKEGRQISAVQAESAAKSKGLSLKDWLSETGFTSVLGKTTVPEDTTPPTEPEKKTAAGDSSLADTSLESPEVDILPGLQYAAEKDLFKADETEGRKRLEAKNRQYP